MTARAAHDFRHDFGCRSHAREHPLVDNRIVRIGRRGSCELRIFLVADLRE
ncbi:MAG TPA: hypothetical protein VGX95_05690 [Xanthobacteraceae bacterium]|nr:hypothetical protein [Xanthobacteraceae bacterium]